MSRSRRVLTAGLLALSLLAPHAARCLCAQPAAAASASAHDCCEKAPGLTAGATRCCPDADDTSRSQAVPRASAPGPAPIAAVAVVALRPPATVAADAARPAFHLIASPPLVLRV